MASIRRGQATDRDVVLALNQEEAKWTSDLDVASLARLIEYSRLFDVVTEAQVVAGFILVMTADSDYPNDNLNWFRSRGQNFWYVDRIVVSSTYAGRGFGRQLYEHLFALAKANGISSIVCEYSLAPLNEGSAAFHERLGFVEIGRRTDTANQKQVSMQQRKL